jgi:hypothetical protein
VAALNLTMADLYDDRKGATYAYLQLDPAILLSSAGSINPIRQLARVEQTVGETWHVCRARTRVPVGPRKRLRQRMIRPH